MVKVKTELNGGSAGDILIKVDVAPHPHFRRQGNRLDVRVPITLAEALGGAKIDLPTPQRHDYAHGTARYVEWQEAPC